MKSPYLKNAFAIEIICQIQSKNFYKLSESAFPNDGVNHTMSFCFALASYQTHLCVGEHKKIKKQELYSMLNILILYLQSIDDWFIYQIIMLSKLMEK